MSDWTAESFAERVFDVGLLDHMQIESIWSEIGSRDVTLEEFISFMLRKQQLTNLQVDRVLKNERYGYFYGRYKILYLVGAGSFARVYRATHVDRDEVVAIKVLRNRFIGDPEVLMHFMEEAKMVKELRHINIVPVYEVDMERNRPYMVMEFVEGQNLREFLKVRKRLEVEEALSTIEDVVNGLDYALSKRVTHRDLKISNVLMTSSKRAKLVDFGLAAVAAVAREEGGKSQRSIDYAGLERLTGVRKNDPRSDLYFTGGILYHLLSGEAPLSESRDRTQRLNASRFREVKPITDIDPNLPADVVHLVQKAMELDADRRFQTPAEFLSEIRSVRRRLQEGEPEPEIGQDGTVRPSKRRQIEREGENHSVMVIESNIEMQDALRDLLKRRGYRVLVIGNMKRALERFEDSEPPAECVIFCTTEMGQEALDAFNRFGAAAHTRHIPAVLFLDEHRTDLAGLADTAEHRVLLPMPLKVRQLRMILLKLLSREKD